MKLPIRVFALLMIVALIVVPMVISVLGDETRHYNSASVAHASNIPLRTL